MTVARCSLCDELTRRVDLCVVPAQPCVLLERLNLPAMRGPDWVVCRRCRTGLQRNGRWSATVVDVLAGFVAVRWRIFDERIAEDRWLAVVQRREGRV